MEWREGVGITEYSPGSKSTNGRLVNPAFEEKRQESIKDQGTNVDGCNLLGSTRQLNWWDQKGLKNDISVMYYPCMKLLSTRVGELNAQLMLTCERSHTGPDYPHYHITELTQAV